MTTDLACLLRQNYRQIKSHNQIGCDTVLVRILVTCHVREIHYCNSCISPIVFMGYNFCHDGFPVQNINKSSVMVSYLMSDEASIISVIGQVLCLSLVLILSFQLKGIHSVSKNNDIINLKGTRHMVPTDTGKIREVFPVSEFIKVLVESRNFR